MRKNITFHAELGKNRVHREEGHWFGMPDGKAFVDKLRGERVESVKDKTSTV